MSSIRKSILAKVNVSQRIVKDVVVWHGDILSAT